MPQIFASIGTNINRKKHLSLALSQLHQRFGPLSLSPVYRSEAVGFEGDDFYNMVAGFESDDSIETINQCFKSIEKQAGRDHTSPKFSDRTLDIDLLNYGDHICQTPIVLPRDEITYHAFVLLPLCDVAPHWIHPVKRVSIKQLWQNFDKPGQQLEKINDPIDMTVFTQAVSNNHLSDQTNSNNTESNNSESINQESGNKEPINKEPQYD